MSNIITARDPGIIAAEINIIKRQVQEAVIYGTIKIGEKLCEAKSLVSQGEWGKWLEENVEYSQSTAENMMKLYREYGGNQQSLFDTWTNSQTFGKLTYTQHLALLALPFSDRQNFAENNNVSDMSTRQLQEAVRQELEEERCLHAETKGELEEMEAKLRDAEQNVLDMQQQISAAKSSEGAWQQEIDKLKKEKSNAEKSESNALSLVKKLEKQLKDAKASEDSIRTELKKAQENPEVPESLMEQLRKEVEATAAQQATGDIQKQLDAANAALAKAEAQTREAEEKLAAAQKQTKMSDPNMMAVQTLGNQLLAIANSINGHRLKAIMQDEANAKPINKYLTYILEELRTAFGIRAEPKNE